MASVGTFEHVGKSRLWVDFAKWHAMKSFVAMYNRSQHMYANPLSFDE